MTEDSTLRIGIDLGGTKIEIAALDATGSFALRERIPTPQGDYEGTIGAIGTLLAVAESRVGVKGPIGIAIPGAISPATGLIKNANSTWLNGRNFEADLKNSLQIPVKLANDANCFALSEAMDGAGKDGTLVFGIIAGTGIGGGLVFNKKIRTGPHAIAGEWGHNPLPWPNEAERVGPPCYCGKRGCIETWLSGPALERIFAQAAGRTADAASIARMAGAGDSVAQDCLGTWFDRFARALAGVVNILDPDVIVLGGGLSNLPTLEEELANRVSAYVFSDEVATPIRHAAFGDSSGVRGAAWLWS